ncbi:hypothetical protein HHI36_009504 [Cryptolaemus montrouzieri]|uniref:Reverse transcriptase n=1 Tax=Cryptolaemus montrouzieri TaxID=559131 RepID=A0ABD2MFW3_9CUCU
MHLGGTPYRMPKYKISRIIKELFPVDYERRERKERYTEITGDKLKEKEVKEAVKRLKGNKAPGMDGISPKALKYLAGKDMAGMTRMFQHYWSSREFPRNWKEARVVLLPKEGKKSDDPSA